MKRKWQFGLRTLTALPILVAIGIVLFDRLWVYDQSQQGFEMVLISVVDASGTPIADAILQSTCTDSGGEPNLKATDAKGTVAFSHSYKYQRFKSLLRDRYNHVSAHHTIAITAPGFKPVSIGVESYRLGKKDDYRLPYPIIVRLDKISEVGNSAEHGK